MFLSFAAYIAYESALGLWSRRAPEHGVPGTVLAGVSLVVMPCFRERANAGGRSEESCAMHVTPSRQNFAPYLSAILLVGLLVIRQNSGQP